MDGLVYGLRFEGGALDGPYGDPKDERAGSPLREALFNIRSGKATSFRVEVFQSEAAFLAEQLKSGPWHYFRVEDGQMSKPYVNMTSAGYKSKSPDIFLATTLVEYNALCTAQRWAYVGKDGDFSAVSFATKKDAALGGAVEHGGDPRHVVVRCFLSVEAFQEARGQAVYGVREKERLVGPFFNAEEVFALAGCGRVEFYPNLKSFRDAKEKSGLVKKIEDASRLSPLE